LKDFIEIDKKVTEKIEKLEKKIEALEKENENLLKYIKKAPTN
jgi:hypothetical protein